MFRNFFKLALRNLTRNKAYSFINIGGLAIGIAVAMLIGLWIHDELSYNTPYKNYNRIAQVRQFVKFDAEKVCYEVLPIPLAEELRKDYPGFKTVSLFKRGKDVFTIGDKNIREAGSFVEPGFASIVSLSMKTGSGDALKDMKSILLSATLAQKLFGGQDPLQQSIRINNQESLTVAGVYNDFPSNSDFSDLAYLAPWDFYLTQDEVANKSKSEWDDNSWSIYVQIGEQANFDALSAQVKDIRMKKENPPPYKPEFFLHPMSRWHLYDDFKNGVNVGGVIKFVWLFGIIGGFVLLLACINFMNLSTARSERRAREVGIRKAIGSMRRQLIFQFYGESLLITFIAFIISIGLVLLTLPAFNAIASKDIHFPWANPLFWITCIFFTFLTGLIAGSYPSLYLSSFQPIKVLKGTFRTGRFAAIPRRALVVIQFTVSVALIICTTIVFRQIQHAKDRPTGYDNQRLIEMGSIGEELLQHFPALTSDLLQTGAVESVAAASCPITEDWGGTTDFKWKGKPEGLYPLAMMATVTTDYGKTVSWQLAQGRDFSRDFKLDTASIIINEAAVALMSLKEPIGELITIHGKNFQVIGVVKNIVRQSPFIPVPPTMFRSGTTDLSIIDLKLSGNQPRDQSLAAVQSVFKKYNPSETFDYQFVDKQFGEKFAAEQKIGKLAGTFAMLAILISCLGLFGMASFMAERRTREIGVRKVLGASVFSVWRLLSKEFVLLVLIAFVVAAPLAWYFMEKWLNNYEYRTDLSWWIFLGAGAGALVIAILTVSFQAIRAGLSNPVTSLKVE